MDTKSTLSSENVMVASNVALALLIAAAMWFLFTKLSDSTDNESPSSIGNALAAVNESTIDNLAEQQLDEQKQLIQKMLAEQMKSINESGAQTQAGMALRDNEITLLKQQNETLIERLSALEKQVQNREPAPAAPVSEVPGSNSNAPNQAAVTELPTTINAGTASSDIPGQATPSAQATTDSGTMTIANTSTQPRTQLPQDNGLAATSTPSGLVHINGTRWVTVEAGDTLSSIAERIYQDREMYPKILSANPEIQINPDLIEPGLRLSVPE